MTDFSAKDPSIGLDLDLGSLIDEDTIVVGLADYMNTMGRATPEVGKRGNLIFDMEF